MGMTPEAFSDVFDRLERDGVRYVVVGSVAVVLHGHVRPVADLDFVIDRTPDEMSRVLNGLYALGFVPSIPLPLSALSVLRMLDQSEREIDVFVRYRIPFAELWAGSEHRPIGQSRARVASLEHLLRMKRITAQPRDLLDIEGLLMLQAASHGRHEAALLAAAEWSEAE